MTIAMGLSVTVSIADEIRGIASSIERVTRVRTLAMLGKTSDSAGTRSTSSKVRASGKGMWEISYGNERDRTGWPGICHA